MDRLARLRVSGTGVPSSFGNRSELQPGACGFEPSANPCECLERASESLPSLL